MPNPLSVLTWKQRLAVAIVLSVVVLLTQRFGWSVKAADQTAIMLSNIENSLTGISSQVTSMREEIHVDRAAMLKRTNDLEQKMKDLSGRVDSLDVTHQNEEVLKDASRITSIEDKLAEAEKEQQEQHDALMGWVKPIALTLFGTLVTVLGSLFLGHLRGSQQKADSDRMEAKVEAGTGEARKAYREANDYAHRERKLETGQAEQGERLDVLEDTPEAGHRNP